MADRDSFDLFALLGRLNKRDLRAFENLTDEGKKAASPLVIMRWLTGTTDQAQIVRLNEVVNRYVFPLGTEKGLLFKLLAAACTGKTGRAQWIKGPGLRKDRLALEAIKARYGCSTREALGYLQFLDASDLLGFAEDAGWDKEQIKKLQVELKSDSK